MHESHERIGAPVLLKEALYKATFKNPNRSLDSAVQVLDLDKFSEWADELS